MVVSAWHLGGRSRRVLWGALRAVGVAVGVIGAGSWLLLAVVHRDDLYGISFVAGAWLGLVHAAAHGVLYPPLFDGRHFGGTRYMPLTIVLSGWLSRATGNDLLAARIVADASAVAVAVLMYLILGRYGIERWLRVFLIGVLAITLAHDTLTLRGDLLALLLQLVAVGLVDRSTSGRSVAVAGLCCALALFSKLNAFWGPIAVVVWLARRSRRRIAPFLAALVMPLVGLLMITDAATQGRFWTNLHELAGSGRVGLVATAKFMTGIEGSPFDLALRYLGATGIALFCLALVGLALSISRKGLTVYHVALVAASVVVWFTLLDVGAADNHLIDLITLSAICIGLLLSPTALAVSDRKALSVLAVGLLTWTAGVTYQGRCATTPRQRSTISAAAIAAMRPPHCSVSFPRTERSSPKTRRSRGRPVASPSCSTRSCSCGSPTVTRPGGEHWSTASTAAGLPASTSSRASTRRPSAAGTARTTSANKSPGQSPGTTA
jgi:hypothetical protein